MKRKFWKPRNSARISIHSEIKLVSLSCTSANRVALQNDACGGGAGVGGRINLFGFAAAAVTCEP